MTPLGSITFECQQLCKAYQTRNGLIPALEDVTFAVGEQEFLCIVGPSGCGKTTLLKLIAGLVEPTSGQIRFVTRPPDGRPRAALVFQEHGLFPWMTVLDNVAFGLEAQGVGRVERRRRARAFIEKVGLVRFAHSYPHELSVGMRQRVGIARAFVAGAPILLMDEPFGSLDAQTRRVLQEELLRLWKDDQKLVVYVTHDIEEAVRLGDRVLVMTGQPGSIHDDIPVPLGRPRGLSAMDLPQIAEIKWRIWKMLEKRVRESLWLPG
jgi:NitT/TauT family transport system ATP-binding protein